MSKIRRYDEYAGVQGLFECDDGEWCEYESVAELKAERDELLKGSAAAYRKGWECGVRAWTYWSEDELARVLARGPRLPTVAPTTEEDLLDGYRG